MSDFDLDLRSVEEQLEDAESDDGGDGGGGGGDIVLGVLDGTTPAGEWVAELEAGAALVLAVEGDLNELAGGLAEGTTELGGDLLQFREFLVVVPPGVDIDRSRL
jgi:hypothetical protein